MKMGFIFNIRFPYFNSNYYAVDLPGEVWKDRYLRYCDTIKVIGRKDPVQEDPSAKIGISSIPEVLFDCVERAAHWQRVFRRRQTSQHIMRSIKDCDFVICRGSWGVRECKKAGKPYMVEVVGCDWDALWNHSWQGKVAAFPRFLALKTAVWNAPYVLYVTKEFLQKRYPTKGKSAGVSDVKIKNLDQSILDQRLHRLISKKEHNHKMVLGTTAAVDVRYKGQQFVIEAMGRLKKQGNTDIQYEIVGGGNPEYLRSVAKEWDVTDQVVLKGPLPHDEVFKWLDNIDVYIQPSLQEGLPRAVVEAMSRGCPVMGSNAGGTPELLGKNMIFKKRDMDNLMSKLKGLNWDNLLLEAKQSFMKAADYQPDMLDASRHQFYMDFLTGNGLPVARKG